jgi:hypothetical protein
MVWHGMETGIQGYRSIPLAAGLVTIYEDVSPVMADRCSLSCYYSNSDVLILTFTFRTQPKVGQEIIPHPAVQQI